MLGYTQINAVYEFNTSAYGKLLLWGFSRYTTCFISEREMKKKKKLRRHGRGSNSPPHLLNDVDVVYVDGRVVPVGAEGDVQDRPVLRVVDLFAFEHGSYLMKKKRKTQSIGVGRERERARGEERDRDRQTETARERKQSKRQGRVHEGSLACCVFQHEKSYTKSEQGTDEPKTTIPVPGTTFDNLIIWKR